MEPRKEEEAVEELGDRRRRKNMCTHVYLLRLRRTFAILAIQTRSKIMRHASHYITAAVKTWQSEHFFASNEELIGVCSFRVKFIMCTSLACLSSKSNVVREGGGKSYSMEWPRPAFAATRQPVKSQIFVREISFSPCPLSFIFPH